MLDREIRREDVQSLSSRDQVAAFLATQRLLAEEHARQLALLAADDRRRYVQAREGGRIVRFTAQYETLVEGRWLAVVRYDCAHGAAHRDVLDIRGREEKHLLGAANLREAIALADTDIRRNWEQYKARFLRGRKRQ